MLDTSLADPRVQAQFALDRVRSRIGLNKLLGRGVNFQLQIMDGLLAGESVYLKSTRCDIGSGDGVDVLLLDDGIANKHVSVVFKASVFGPIVSATAHAPGVSLAGQPLDVGQSTQYQAMPLDLEIYKSKLRIAPVSARQRRTNPTVVRIWRFVRMMAVFAFVLGVIAWVSDYPQFKYDMRTLATSQRDRVTSVSTDNESAIREAGRVTQKLQELGLSSFVDVGNVRDGQMHLTGVLPPEMQASWITFRKWHDERSASILVSDVVAAFDFDTLPAIAMVRLSEPPGLILVDGRTVAEGERLTDDLLLEQVTEDKLVVSRKGHRMMIGIGH